MSWQGKILRVNLSERTCTSEPLNMDWAEAYLGQRGLGSKYLIEETEPNIDPLSPENRLIVATGPLTGTMASTGGRWSVICKSPLTNALACSNSGGYFGAELKNAGWDMMIFEGKAEKPVYLEIKDDIALLHDASAYWGRSVWEIEPELKQKHGDPQARVASIGRAGESLARIAAVINDLHRAAGRSGVGAVMGSKNLKAIIVRGTGGVSVKDPARFMEAVRAAKEKLDPSERRIRLGKFGTHAMMDATNSFGSLPTRNSRDLQFEGVKKINAKAVTVPRLSDGKPNLIGTKACFGCTIACGRMGLIDPTYKAVAGEDKARYRKGTGGLEYENAYAFGPMCGIDDLDALMYANMVCNEDGLDTISFGATLSAAMELFETGAITTENTGGIDLSFGNADALITMVELTGKGEGFGKEIGLGSKRLCEKYGHPEFSMTVRGQEFPGYEPRAMKGMALAYATSSRGACHLRAAPFVPDFTKVTTEGKAEVVKFTQDKNALVDSSGLCTFPGPVWDPEDLAPKFDAALPGKWTAERIMECGERIWTMERLYNTASGLGPEADTLPDRQLKEPAGSGAAKGQTAELEKMLPEYYELRGWTPQGHPAKETLQRLGLA